MSVGVKARGNDGDEGREGVGNVGVGFISSVLWIQCMGPFRGLRPGPRDTLTLQASPFASFCDEICKLWTDFLILQYILSQ